MDRLQDKAFGLLSEQFGGSLVESVVEQVAQLPVEVPSWGFGRGGTRFGTFRTGKEAKTVTGRIKAAGQFRALTGKGQTVAIHIPWDGEKKTEIGALAKLLKKAGVKAGSINCNLFTPRKRGPLDARLRFGSLTNPVDAVRKASVQHNLDCIDIMRRLGSDTLVLWLPDGTNSPGQLSLYDQADLLETSLRAICRKLRKGEKILVEYKYFEPGMYATAIQDYGRSRSLCRMLGPKAKVLLDLGHHAPTTNVEHVVALLVRGGDLGGFHFNDHAYADDDLATGSLNPGQLFRIMCNLVEGERRGFGDVRTLALMIDQSHNIKDPLTELVESLTNIETAYAKALLVDGAALRKAQLACDASRGDAILRDAFLTDVRPLLAKARAMAV